MQDGIQLLFDINLVLKPSFNLGNVKSGPNNWEG
jgi:hypothetical protein